MIEHFVSGTCEGETCSICGKPATHKVGEEIAHDDPAWKDVLGHTLLTRHNYTAYVCCEHFRMVFGRAVPCLTTNAGGKAAGPSGPVEP